MVVGGATREELKVKVGTPCSHFLSALNQVWSFSFEISRVLRLIDNSWFSDGGTNRHVKELTRKHPAVYRFFRLRLRIIYNFLSTIILTYGYSHLILSAKLFVSSVGKFDASGLLLIVKWSIAEDGCWYARGEVSGLKYLVAASCLPL